MPISRHAVPLAAAVLAVVCLAGAAAPPSLPAPPIPLPGASGWSSAIDNPYLQLTPGHVWVYATREGAEAGTDSVEVLRETRAILGVAAVVVRDRSYRGGKLTEDSNDWYAQDGRGNVWYLGEDTRAYRDGRVTSTAGSWEAGKYGALPGIVMWAHPAPGGAYRQEYRRGSAEDMARVLSNSASVVVEGITYQGCVLTEEWSPLEPGVKENKFYAKGVGLVRMETATGPHEEMTLVGVSTR